MLSGNDSGDIPSADGTGTGNQLTGGTNDVTASWDGTVYTAASDLGSAANMTLASTTAFFGHLWTAKGVQVFQPGTYNFTYTPVGGGSTPFTMVVPPGHLGTHMLFDWNTTSNINVFQVWACDGAFNGTLSVDSNAAGHNASTVWGMVSTDTRMPDGPFVGSNANFNLHITLPAAACSRYNFQTQADVTTNTLVTSNSQTVAEPTSPSDVSIAAGSAPGSEFSIDGGVTWNTGTVTGVANGTNIIARHTSASTGSTSTTTTVTIGAINATFTSITAVVPVVAADDPAMPGCSLSTDRAGNPLARADWWLVGGFVLWLAAVRRRLRGKS
jgi:hypothetical protein